MSEYLTKRIPRGKGWHNTGTTVATASLTGGDEFLGTVVMFNDESARSVNAPVSKRSAGQAVFILVQNAAAFPLLPGDAVTWAAGYRGKKVDGKVCVANAEIAGIVDTDWPAAGVPVGEKFWLQIKGHALGRTPLEGDGTNVFAEGSRLVAVTAATSGATTAGRIKAIAGTFSAAETTNGTAIDILTNWLGRAISAKTTANTNQSILIELDTHWSG